MILECYNETKFKRSALISHAFRLFQSEVSLQEMPVVHQPMGHEHLLRLHARSLPHQSRIGSVVLGCVALLSYSPRKSPLGSSPSPAESLSSSGRLETLVLSAACS